MKRAVVVGVAAVVVLVGMAVGVYATRTRAPRSATIGQAGPPGDDLLLVARTRGAENAPITIYEVSDFQCPYCRQFWAETLPKLAQEYISTGKVKLTFINFPIKELHPNAALAHQLAMCAAQQNQFWPMHDLLYAHQMEWAKLADPQAYFLTLADSAKMERSSLEQCLVAGRVEQLVAAESEASWRAGVRSTPSFIVQGALLSGSAPIDKWRPILDSLYALRGGR